MPREQQGARALRVAALIGTTAVLAACATTDKPPSPQELANACSTLKTVVASGAKGFDSVKGRKTVYGPMFMLSADRWDTTSLFPSTECEIWQWGNGYTHYTCLWHPNSEAEARSDYDYGKREVQSCLGSAWQMSEQPGKQGVAATFAKAGEPVQVVLQLFQDTRGFSRTWHTSLVVGADVLKAGALYPPGSGR